jgi:hypothetical protein
MKQKCKTYKIDKRYLFKQIALSIGYILTSCLILEAISIIFPTRKTKNFDFTIFFSLLLIVYVIIFVNHKRITRIEYCDTENGKEVTFTFNRYLFFKSKIRNLIKELSYSYREEAVGKRRSHTIFRIYKNEKLIYKSSGRETIDGWRTEDKIDIINKLVEYGAREHLT